MALTAAEKQQRHRERHLGIDGAKLRAHPALRQRSRQGPASTPRRHYGRRRRARSSTHCRGASTPPISTATNRNLASRLDSARHKVHQEAC
jgi:hypothetical protein